MSLVAIQVIFILFLDNVCFRLLRHINFYDDCKYDGTRTAKPGITLSTFG